MLISLVFWGIQMAVIFTIIILIRFVTPNEYSNFGLLTIYGAIGNKYLILTDIRLRHLSTAKNYFFLKMHLIFFFLLFSVFVLAFFALGVITFRKIREEINRPAMPKLTIIPRWNVTITQQQPRIRVKKYIHLLDDEHCDKV